MRFLIQILIFLIPSNLVGQFGVDVISQTYLNSENGGKYLAPINETYSSLIHSGIFSRYSEKGFHIKLGLHVTRINITESMNFYRGVTDNFEEEIFHDVPTIVGPTNTIEISNDQGTQYTFPGGLGINYITLIAPELYIGTLFGTDFFGRYALLPLKGNLGNVEIYGGGIRHDFGRYFFPEYIKWYLAYSYHLMDIGGYIKSVNQYAMTQFGVKLNRIGIYGLFGYELNDMQLKYNFDDNSIQDINLELKDRYPYRYGGGLSLSFKYFDVFGEYIMNNPVNYVIGMSVGI